MAKLNYDGGGCGIPASGDASAAKKVANLAGSPAKMGTASGMKEVGIKPMGGMSAVPSAAGSMGGATKNVAQSGYNSEAKQGTVDSGKAGMPKGYYGDRDGK